MMSGGLHRYVFCLGVLAGLLGAAAAAAQPQGEKIESARDHMELGQNAFETRDYETAAEQFIKAYDASPFPAFLYNAGLAYEKWGRPGKAAEMYRQYLDEEPSAVDRTEVEAKIRALLGDVQPESPPGEPEPEAPAVAAVEVEMKSLISVRTNPADAKFRVLDVHGHEISQFDGPAAQTVVRGTYTLEVSHPDYRTVQTGIDVVPGQVYIVVVEMSQGEFLGLLSVKTDVPGAAVYVDDKKQGKVGVTPWSNVLPTGSHTLWIEKPGYIPIEQKITISIGDQLSLAHELKRVSHGVVRVKTNIPGAMVHLDGKEIGGAPLKHRARPGRHTLKVTAEGMKDYETEFKVGRGQATKALVRMNPKPSRTSAWVSFGFSVALFTGGGIIGGVALKYKNELETERNAGRLADDDPRILKGFLLALSADITFGVGAIIGGLCIYYFLRDPLPPSEGKVYDPADFDAKKPETDAGAQQTLDKEESTSGDSATSARVLVAPLVTSEAAGLGLVVVF